MATFIVFQTFFGENKEASPNDTSCKTASGETIYILFIHLFLFSFVSYMTCARFSRKLNKKLAVKL